MDVGDDDPLDMGDDDPLDPEPPPPQAAASTTTAIPAAAWLSRRDRDADRTVETDLDMDTVAPG
jgi:hypothetical protein